MSTKFNYPHIRFHTLKPNFKYIYMKSKQLPKQTNIKNPNRFRSYFPNFINQPSEFIMVKVAVSKKGISV